MTEVQKIKKHYNKVKADELVNLINSTDLTTKKLSEETGLNCTTINAYIRANEMPQYMNLVIEAYKKRMSKNENTTYVISGNSDILKPIIQMLYSLNIVVQQINY